MQSSFLFAAFLCRLIETVVLCPEARNLGVIYPYNVVYRVSSLAPTATGAAVEIRLTAARGKHARAKDMPA